MSEMNEIAYTIKKVKKYNNNICITQCTSAYPCPPSISDIGVIKTFKNKFKLPVGLSDHTNNNYTSFGAIALGAVLIEKHFTLDKKMNGPDHASSINPEELKELVEGCNAIYSAKSERKVIHKEERQIISWARESVVSTKNIKIGERLNKHNISVKRPAPNNKEIAPKYFNKIIGKEAKKNIRIDKKIKWSEIG
jgi:sialic acid synthase SpsE